MGGLPMPQRLRWRCHILLLAALMPCVTLADLGVADSAAHHDDSASPAAPAVASSDSGKDGDSGASEAPVAVDSDISAPAALEEIVKAIRSELENKKYQPVVAALAFVFGCVLVFDGEFCLRWLIASAVFVVVASMAMNQVSSSWELGSKDDNILRYIVGLEAGCIGAFAAFKGMDGMRVSVGAALGVLVALKTEEVLAEHGVNMEKHRWIEVVYYSAFAIFSSILLYKNKHLKLLAVLSAGLGGAFCSSTIAFAVTTLAVQGYLPFLDQACPGLTPKTGSWVQFFDMLWSPKAPVRGIFVDSKYNPVIEGNTFSMDKMADYCLWFAFWLIGSVVQLRRLRRAALPKLPVQEPLLGELPK